MPHHFFTRYLPMTSASPPITADPNLAPAVPPLGAAPARTRRRGGRWVVLAVVLALVAAVLPMAVRMLRPVPPPDVGTVKTTAGGRYRVRLAPEAPPVPLQRLHRWTVQIEPAAGAPGGALGTSPTGGALTVTVDGGMPQHGHGLPTQPRVTGRLPDGRFVIDGMKFSMPGWWELRLGIAGAAGPDRVTFNLTL